MESQSPAINFCRFPNTPNGPSTCHLLAPRFRASPDTRSLPQPRTFQPIPAPNCTTPFAHLKRRHISAHFARLARLARLDLRRSPPNGKGHFSVLVDAFLSKVTPSPSATVTQLLAHLQEASPSRTTTTKHHSSTHNFSASSFISRLIRQTNPTSDRQSHRNIVSFYFSNRTFTSFLGTILSLPVD